MCGDGLVVGIETCDNGNNGGCNSTCTGVSPYFTCTGGSPTSSSVCTCNTGYSFLPSLL